MFNITTTKKKFNANDVSFGGKYPYVVRTSENNGIRGSIDEDTQYLNDGNTISFGQDTATIFYQESPYFTGDKIKILTPKFRIDRQIASYLLTCMRKSFSNFQWGVTSFNVSILSSIRIVLPVSQSGNIDYAFMHAYIQEMEHGRIEDMNGYLNAAGFENCVLTEEEKKAIAQFPNKDTKRFEIDTLFVAKKGDTDLQQTDINGKGTYFINSGVTDFGIKGKTDREATIFPSNTITIDFWGNAYYRDFEYKLATHNHVFSLSGSVIKNLEIGLYLTATMRYMNHAFSYDNMGTWPKIKCQRIELPITSTDDIDYHFMELYIRAQEKLAIQRLKEWQSKEFHEDVKEEKQSIQIPIHETIPETQKFTTYLPLYTLRAACGYFIDHEEPEVEGWVDVTSAIPHLNKDMFLVHAKGDSMLPKIKDGDLCVFELYHGGSRNGEIVLTQLNERDYDYGGSYTIKKYHSEKKQEDGVMMHTKVELQPLNTDGYSSIEIQEETSDNFTTIAILKCVL